MLNSTIVIVRLLAALYGVSPDYAQCIVQHESDYDALAANGPHLGIAQFKIETMHWALKRMGLPWDWQRQGDPRRVPAVSAAAMLTCMWWGYERWWSTDGLCRRECHDQAIATADSAASSAPTVAADGAGCASAGANAT